jgi:hypothetical protein
LWYFINRVAFFVPVNLIWVNIKNGPKGGFKLGNEGFTPDALGTERSRRGNEGFFFFCAVPFA